MADLFWKSSAREVKIFQNLQLLSRSFFEMHSSVIDHFSKSSTAGLLFFLNLQLGTRSFPETLSSRTGLFCE